MIWVFAALLVTVVAAILAGRVYPALVREPLGSEGPCSPRHSPAASLARRCAASLRSSGSLAALARAVRQLTGH